MSGYTGPTGPTGIDGMYGRQGLVGPGGVRGNRGPIPDVGISKMQYQSFSVIGETELDGGAGQFYLRSVFQYPNPDIALSHIPGMQIVSSNVLSVPRGTYSVQASSVGVSYTSGGLTSVLAIGDTTVSNTCLLAGTPAYGSFTPFGLDGVITFNSTTNVELRHYKTGGLVIQSYDDTATSWSCFISFMKIQ